MGIISAVSGERRFAAARRRARATVVVLAVRMSVARSLTAQCLVNHCLVNHCLVNHCLGAVYATAAACTDRELHLHLSQAARALIDCAADLPIGNAVTYANVHSETTPESVSLPNDQNVNANANDCQFTI
jgi:hypothetical protein